MKNIYTIIILFVAFVSFSFGQELNLTSETTTISAGAEYSQYLRKMINSGNADKIKFNSIIEKFNKISDITTYEGINFTEDGANNGGFVHIPPDPSGAAGPNHLVSVVNCSIEWFTKAGANQHSESLQSFFASLSPLTATFDPKVIYDQYNDRFVVVTLEQTDVAYGDASNTSRIFIAVSQSSDPNGGWYFDQIDSKKNISGTDTWADYPGFAVGTDAIYLTFNMFTFGTTNSYRGARLWIIAKTPFYSGSPATVTFHNPYPVNQETTYQPAHMFGTPQSAVGTFLVAYSGLSNGTNEFVNVIRIDDPVGTPVFNFQQFTVGNIDNTATSSFPDAPQLDAVKGINTNDRRTLNAVWRNNSLWVTTTVIPPSGTNAGQVTAHWFRLSTATLTSISLADQGDIGGETIATGCYTFFPSIAVNSSNDVCIGFAASASTIYPGCYYTGRLSGDPAGTTVTPDSVRKGMSSYVRTFTSGSTGRNRWGDYSGTSVDPFDGLTFYVFNEYAFTHGSIILGENGRWGTAFGKVPVSSLPVELASFSASVIGSSVNLNWETATEINNYGFEIERSVISAIGIPSEDEERNLSWNKIGFVNGNGNSNSPKSYNFEDKNALSGKFSYRLKQIDNDGQFEYSKVIDVDLGTPKKFELSQNYPNPFNPATTIRYSLPEAGNVKLIIYNILGQEIKTLVNELKEAGVHTINFNADNLNSGLYIYKLEAGAFVETRKMTLVK